MKVIAYCAKCGCSDLIWGNDFDIDGITDGEVEGLLSCYTCPNCGSSVYVVTEYADEEEE